MLNPKNKVQSLLVHQNTPYIPTRAVSARNMGQCNFLAPFILYHGELHTGFENSKPVTLMKQLHTNKPKLHTRKTLHESHVHCHAPTTETNSKVHAS